MVEELIQSDADGCTIASELEDFLTHPDKVRELQAKMAEVIAKLGGTGAHRKAAEAVASWFPQVA